MNVIGVIPSRYASTRFPGKPLALIRGKPMLQWVIEGCERSRELSSLLVATDDERIERLARSLGVEVTLTDSDLPSGSDRVWAAVKGKQADIVVNIQGDEPLLEAHVLDALVGPLKTKPEIQMATLGRELKPGDLNSTGTAKILLNELGEAIYFSRLPVPYSRIDAPHEGGVCLKHIGLYAYRKDFLQRFCEEGPVELEKAEGLEQLRALYLRARIAVVKVEAESWGVDVPADIQKVEAILRGKGQ